MISSSSNAQMKYLVKLQEKGSVRKADRVYICEGRKMFGEVLQYAQESVVKAYFAESCFRENEEEWQQRMKECRVSYEIVSDSVFREVSQTVTPQGVLAVVRQPEYSLASILCDANGCEKNQLRLLLLEDLRDPGNLGTILRTAEGAGMDGVILSAESVDVFNPKVIRATMGAIYRLPFFYAASFTDLLGTLKEHGISIFAAHLAGSQEYDTVRYPKKTAIMIGNEANGLSEQATQLSDARIRIPMEGAVESLNAGVAAAILMYELYRQKRFL